jgi:hypothetical protein
MSAPAGPAGIIGPRIAAEAAAQRPCRLTLLERGAEIAPGLHTGGNQSSVMLAAGLAGDFLPPGRGSSAIGRHVQSPFVAAVAVGWPVSYAWPPATSRSFSAFRAASMSALTWLSGRS